MKSMPLIIKNMSKVRLNKFIAQSGVASRRKSDDLILEGRVEINGQVVDQPGTLVDPKKDKVLIDKAPIAARESSVVYLFHKPEGYLCSHTGKKTIYSFFSHDSRRLFSAGRLDKDSSGLMIITNDGSLTQKIIHPSSDLQKEYLVKTSAEVNASHLKALSSGCRIEGSFVRPIKVKKMRKGTIKITVKEGKKHEVRMLMENAALPVLSLKRIRIGNLMLGNLPVGAYKKVSVDDVLKAFD